MAALGWCRIKVTIHRARGQVLGALADEGENEIGPREGGRDYGPATTTDKKGGPAVVGFVRRLPAVE